MPTAAEFRRALKAAIGSSLYGSILAVDDVGGSSQIKTTILR